MKNCFFRRSAKRHPLAYHIRVYVFSVIAFANTIFSFRLTATAAEAEKWELGIVDESGKAPIYTFKQSSPESMSFPGFEFDPKYRGANGKSLGYTYASKPDFKKEVLRYGLAKLVDFPGAQKVYQDAEREAIINARGTWSFLEDLEFDTPFRNSPEKQLPFKMDVKPNTKTDLKYELLTSGVAKLRSFRSADGKYQDAETQAVVHGTGLWAFMVDVVFDTQYLAGPSKRLPVDYDTSDFKLVLIKAGIARLRMFDKAEQNYRDAQMEAISLSEGMWSCLVDLELDEQYRNHSAKGFAFDYGSVADFKLAFLRCGAGKLRNFTLAEKRYKQAEHLAVLERDGLWSTLPKFVYDAKYTSNPVQSDFTSFLPINYSGADTTREILVNGVGRLLDFRLGPESACDAEIEGLLKRKGMWAEYSDLQLDEQQLQQFLNEYEWKGDFRLELLNNGRARLLGFSRADQIYQDAEHRAIVAGRGMWSDFSSFKFGQQYLGSRPRKLPIDYDTMDLGRAILVAGAAKLSDPQVASPTYRAAEAEARSKGAGLWPTPDATPWWSNPVVLGLIGFIGLGGFVEFYHLLAGFRKRKEIVVLFMGRPSTGKSWVWARLQDPEISRDDLEKIERTEGMKKFSLLPRGDHTLVPVCTDIAGNDPATIVRESLDPRGWFNQLRRWFFPKKYIWLIMLATAERRGINRNSKEDEKISTNFIAEQRGAMDLPKGLLQANGGKGPIAVFFCITKVDLFLDMNPMPNPVNNEEAKKCSVLRNLFRKHIDTVKTIGGDSAQDSRQPKFYDYLVSAAEGWGIDILERRINEEIRKVK